MDLPEIRAEVALFLCDSDLCAAALVCKSWHASFIPFLYSNVAWSRSVRHPTADVILTNAHHIRSIYLYVDQSVLGDLIIFADNCTKLETIAVQAIGWGPTNWVHFSAIVQRNTNIKSITIILSGRLGIPLDVMKTLSSASSLRALRIESGGSDVACMEHLLEIAVRLEYLRIVGIHNSGSMSLERWPCFPNMRSLDLNADTKPAAQLQFEMIRRCPELKALCLNIAEENTCSSSDICALFKSHCPLVEKLELWTELLLTDEELALVVDGCGRLICLQIFEPRFGNKAFQSLTRHFSSLKVLTFGRNNEVTSKMAQQIVTRCLHLTSLEGITMDACDILGIAKVEEEEKATVATPTTTNQGTAMYPPSPDWSCTRLESLGLTINGLEGKPQDWNRRVLQQLGKLKQLTALRFDPHCFGPSTQDGLDMRLEAGLDELSSLKQLCHVDFGVEWRKMEEQDIRWMLEAWPELSWMDGNLHRDLEERSRLERILYEENIRGPGMFYEAMEYDTTSLVDAHVGADEFGDEIDFLSSLGIGNNVDWDDGNGNIDDDEEAAQQ
ncbi:hypothetical protein B0O80DRAFT_502081 [Mortierella sp. GBAus27b]|nr:hypothetical protein BGX31_005771 [Mortierella sp. GBA43]KAI8348401.1 hypothetical protein B0O80DRAFT_502081 [Mortierella sp. GBAus27b]